MALVGQLEALAVRQIKLDILLLILLVSKYI